MERDNVMKALYIIVNAGFAEDAIDLARKDGVTGAAIFSARGEGVHHETIMGITIDTEKDMIVCVTDEQAAEKAMASIKKTMGVKTPAQGVCFTMPVEKAIGLFNE